MGWTYSESFTKDNVLSDILSNSSKVIDYYVDEAFDECEDTKFVVYALKEFNLNGRSYKSIDVIIVREEFDPYKKRSEIGYKELNESEFPYYFNCPQNLIDMADPPVNDYAKRWRDAVSD